MKDPFEEELSAGLHQAYDPMVAGPDFRRRLSQALGSRPTADSAPASRTMVSPSMVSRRGRWPWMISAAAAVVVILAVVVLTSRSVPPPAPPTAGPPDSQPVSGSPSSSNEIAASAASPVEVCGDPQSLFARFWYITAGYDPDAPYRGTVQVGKATVPASSLYVSGGPPGTGVLCVSNFAVAVDPVRSWTEVRAGKDIGYVGDTAGILYFAVSPAVNRVVVDYGKNEPASYTLDGVAENQLQPIGGGWHAVGTGFGRCAYQEVTIHAFDSAGKLLESLPYRFNPDDCWYKESSSAPLAIGTSGGPATEPTPTAPRSETSGSNCEGTLLRPVATRRLPYGSIAYEYDLPNGSSFMQVAPPSGFDPDTASDGLLAELGLPFKPTEPAQLADWENQVSPFRKSAIGPNSEFCSIQDPRMVPSSGG